MSMAQPFHCVSMVARIVLQNGSWHHHADIIIGKCIGIYLYYMSMFIYYIYICVCAYLCFNMCSINAEWLLFPSWVTYNLKVPEYVLQLTEWQYLQHAVVFWMFLSPCSYWSKALSFPFKLRAGRSLIHCSHWPCCFPTKLQPNVVTYNTYISLCGQACFDHGLGLVV